MWKRSLKSGTAAALLCPVLLAYCVGCNRAGSPDAGNGQASNWSVEERFQSSCNCHYGGSRKAPDLSHIGSDPTHTAGWIAEYASNPKSKDAGSMMPPQQGKVSSEDLQAIAVYLANRK